MPALRQFILLLSFSLCGAVAIAKPVTETDLRKHVEILASDDFEGRAPGTDGERKTLAYLESHPPANFMQRRKIVSAFLDKFALPERIGLAVEMLSGPEMQFWWMAN